MLEAIRKFVLERGRDPHQSRRLIVEENGSGHAPNNSDVPPGLAEPELEGSSGLVVRGQVKWFNPNKGYGFVQLSDGSGDAFLHASALAGISIDALQPGVTIEFRTAPAQRGLQVTEVIGIVRCEVAPFQWTVCQLAVYVLVMAACMSAS
jgi:CspA family cold shock protein